MVLDFQLFFFLIILDTLAKNYPSLCIKLFVYVGVFQLAAATTTPDDGQGLDWGGCNDCGRLNTIGENSGGLWGRDSLWDYRVL